MGLIKNSAYREIHSNTSLTQETRETPNKQPTFTYKATRKRIKEEPQSQKKERNHKNQSRKKWGKKKARSRLQQKSTKLKADFLRR